MQFVAPFSTLTKRNADVSAHPYCTREGVTSNSLILSRCFNSKHLFISSLETDGNHMTFVPLLESLEDNKEFLGGFKRPFTDYILWEYLSVLYGLGELAMLS